MADINIYVTEQIEWEAIQPIAKQLVRMGHSISFASPGTFSKIGLYCLHDWQATSDLSFGFLHDLMQYHDYHPHFWENEAWHSYDIGFLPTVQWGKMAIQEATDGEKHFPKEAMYYSGWPKFDLLASLLGSPEDCSDRSFLANRPTVIYAPSWENDGKYLDVLESLKDLRVNLVFKWAKLHKGYGYHYDAIEEALSTIRGLPDEFNAQIYAPDPSISIMEIIAKGDLLISDESCCLIEAHECGLQTLAVSNWWIPDTGPGRPPSISYHYRDVIKRISKCQLREAVSELLSKDNAYDPVSGNFSRSQSTANPRRHRLGSESLIAASIVHNRITGEKANQIDPYNYQIWTRLSEQKSIITPRMCEDK